MTTTFSTQSNTIIDNPLMRLLFQEDDQPQKPTVNPLENLLNTEKNSTNKDNLKKETKSEENITPDQIPENEPKQPEDDNSEKEDKKSKNTKDEIEDFEPIIIKPETDLNKDDKESILEHLSYNLNKLKIPHKVKVFGYHNRKDEFITTEYAIIDNQSKNTILIVHLSKKEIRYQIPSHQKENKRLTKFVKNFQKELKYSLSDWF